MTISRKNVIGSRGMSKKTNLEILAIMLIAVFLTSCGLNSNAFETLKQQRYVLIKDGDPIYKDSEVGIDLREEAFYYNSETAIKDGKIYGGYSEEKDPSKYYERALYNEISSALLNLKVSKDEIRKSDYTLERNPDSLVTKSFLKEEYPPEFEGTFRNKERQFSKVRISYNKDFLPTKIEWYYKGAEGLKWYTWRTYSYPFKNKADFDKRLDEEIEIIQAIEEEKEAEARQAELEQAE